MSTYNEKGKDDNVNCFTSNIGEISNANECMSDKTPVKISERFLKRQEQALFLLVTKRKNLHSPTGRRETRSYKFLRRLTINYSKASKSRFTSLGTTLGCQLELLQGQILNR